MNSGLCFTWLKTGGRTPGEGPLLSVKQLSVRVGIRRVLEGIDLDLFPGDRICVSGSNGSGKSTLLNAIAGVPRARIESGSIVYRGRDITHMPAHVRARDGMAYMMQSMNVFAGLTVYENLILALGEDGARNYMKQAPPEWSLVGSVSRPAGSLSGGERQKLAYALCCRPDTRLLLADEPDAGLHQWAGLPFHDTYIIITHSS